jgi:TonB family protein
VLEQDLDVAKDAAVRSANAPPLLIHSAEPLFTTDAIRAKYHGVVLISALIGKDGVPTEVRETKPLGMGLDQLAIDAVQRYRYLPALKDGVPVAERVNITVNLKVY